MYEVVWLGGPADEATPLIYFYHRFKVAASFHTTN
jgi:hypothetical protein